MKQFIFVCGAIFFSAFVWDYFDLKIVEYRIPEPYFIVKTYEENTCVNGSGNTVVYRTVEQMKVDVETNKR